MSLALKKITKSKSQKTRVIVIIINSCPIFGCEIKTAIKLKIPVRLQSVIADNFLDNPALPNLCDK